MSVDYLIDIDRRVVFTVAIDLFAVTDAVRHMTRLQADPDFSPSFNQIADFRAVTEVRLSGLDVLDLSRQTVFTRDARRALVIDKPLAFGLARMFATLRGLSGEQHLTIVRALDEAARWTRVDPDVAAQACATLTDRMRKAG
jgi:hypothetical protein